MSMQVRFQSESERQAEQDRSIRRDATIPKSELRLDAVSATRVGGTRRVNDRTRGSAVISWKPDADGNLVPRLFNPKKSHTRTRTSTRETQAEIVARQSRTSSRTPEEVAALIGIPAPKQASHKYDHDYTSH